MTLSAGSELAYVVANLKAHKFSGDRTDYYGNDELWKGRHIHNWIPAVDSLSNSTPKFRA